MENLLKENIKKTSRKSAESIKKLLKKRYLKKLVDKQNDDLIYSN